MPSFVHAGRAEKSASVYRLMNLLNNERDEAISKRDILLADRFSPRPKFAG
jgi:hypothetical protein